MIQVDSHKKYSGFKLEIKMLLCHSETKVFNKLEIFFSDEIVQIMYSRPEDHMTGAYRVIRHSLRRKL